MRCDRDSTKRTIRKAEEKGGGSGSGESVLSARAKLRRVLLKASLCVVSVSVGLIILEFGTRVLLPSYDPSGMITFHFDQDGVPLARKNFVGRQWKNTGDYDVSIRINRYGFRDAKDIDQSTEADFSVVGDSFSFGWGVEEEHRYSDFLESMLGVPVYNISIPTDIDGYCRLVQYAQRNGATIGNLIVGVSMENDLKDYGNQTRAGRVEGRGRVLARSKAYLATHSASYNAVTAIIHHHEPLKRIAAGLGLVTDNLEGIASQSYSQIVIGSSCSKLIGLAERCRAAKMTIVVIPSRRLWVGAEREKYLNIHDDFVQSLKDHGLEVVDLRGPFERGGNPLGYHFEHDGHWNEKGHLVAAEQIHEFLLDRPRDSSRSSVDSVR